MLKHGQHPYLSHGLAGLPMQYQANANLLSAANNHPMLHALPSPSSLQGVLPSPTTASMLMADGASGKKRASPKEKSGLGLNLGPSDFGADGSADSRKSNQTEDDGDVTMKEEETPEQDADTPRGSKRMKTSATAVNV